ncbi:hypothetical protein [Marinomonas balearica]|uniref:Membrane protein DUF2157 n=1 Tax=Marinomonas balearica TaxID=491947 RepID=A0A4R6MJC7_9GAMM|nr:hypothetical protein [Marinomonas balearica]TDP01845.1 hypothetical protein DFP79_0019 [Marinomonas balearica]
MYTDEDLDNAAAQGIFQPEDVASFRDYMQSMRHTTSADEENVRLITSFNDIFVVIAMGLFLFSLVWLGDSFHDAVGPLLAAVASWGLAEFFVLKRKMALPAIVLLLSFTGGIFSACSIFFMSIIAAEENSLIISAIVTVAAAYLHWRRFAVPITIAAGAIATLVFFVSLALSVFPTLQDIQYIDELAFISGALLFAFAIWWDAQDRKRVKKQSDIAFWLHLSAAPLIVHSVFANLTADNTGGTQLLSIIALYLVLTVISLIIDRRAFMVSALAYVLYALVDFMNTYGMLEDSLATVGVTLGLSLLVLSGFWHKARAQIVRVLPDPVRIKVP